ncbi:MAG: transposase, partial [Sphaerochaetaceae bacterium]
NHAIFPISNGPLEGTNNLIKTIRRQAFGYRDQQYFFLKIWEATRKKPKTRFYKSHRFRA